MQAFPQRPRKGEERRPKDKTRLERQAAGDMTLEQMLDDLPKDCDRGAKVNAQGFRNAWVGYKFHIDAIDTDMPVVCILTSASVHDSQVAIPLVNITTPVLDKRVDGYSKIGRYLI